MKKLVRVIIALVLALHGLVHLMGTAVYMKLGRVEGLTYKTTLLGGSLELGEGGMAVYGALWAVAAVGFLAAAAALAAGWRGWRPLLVGVALFSLLLTALDWGVAYAGIAVNVAILAAVWLGPRIASRKTHT